MNGKESIQGIWAVTDKPVIDRMSQKTPLPTSNGKNGFASNYEGSDEDSDSSSKGSFIAVPEEFRPNFTPSRAPAKKSRKRGTKFTLNNSLGNNSEAVPSELNSNTTPSIPFEVRRKDADATPSKSSLMRGVDAEAKSIPSISFEVQRKDAEAKSIKCSNNIYVQNLPKITRKSTENDQAVASPYSSVIKHDKLSVNKPILPERKIVPDNTFSNGRIAAHLNSLTVEYANTFCANNSLPVDIKSSVKENTITSKVGTAKKVQKLRDEISIEMSLPRKNEEPFETCTTIAAPRRCITHKTMKMHRNPVSPHNSTRITFSNELEKKISQKKPQFQCITESEDIKISKTQFIEIDFAKLSIDNNINASKHQSTSEKMKKMTGIPKKKNIKSSNSIKRNKCSSQYQPYNTSEKGEWVKWSSTLSLNKTMHSSQNHFIPKSESEDNFHKTSNNKVEWTVEKIHEERTVISVKRVVNENKIDRDHLLLEDDDTKEFSSIDKFSKRPLRNETLLRFRNTMPDFRNNDDLNNWRPQHTDHCIWEKTQHKINKCRELEINQDFKQNTETKFKDGIKEQNSYDKYSTCAVNTSGNKLCCQFCLRGMSDFLQEGNKGVQETKYDQFVDNHSHQDSAAQPSVHNIKSSNQTVFKEKNGLIHYGKDISDLIVGCHTALSTFFSFYKEWKISRSELIDHFQQLEKNIKESCKKYRRYQDLPKVANTVALVATAIPHPYIGIAAKVVSIISSLVEKFFIRSNTRKADVDEPEIIGCLLKDIDASSDVYIYGLQCNGQLEETLKLIEEFHSKAANHELLDEECLDRDIMTFIQGMLEYKPQQSTFYKKLHRCFQELLQKSSSPFSRRFCEPFLLNSSDAVDVIGYLNWRFLEFNNESVKHELEDICHMIQSSATSMEDLALRITNCIRILNDELKSVERCVSKVPLFDSSKSDFK